MPSRARVASTISVALGVVALTLVGLGVEGPAGCVELAQKSTTTETTTVVTADTSKHFSVHAFDINADADDLIPAPTTAAGTVSAGDEMVINDQLTATHEKHGGYPIVGYDSGTCVYTRTAPDGQSDGSPFNVTIESCLATAHLPHGTVSATGVITNRAGKPMPTIFTILGGTGRYVDTRGTMTIAFGKDFNTYTFSLK